MSKVLVNESSLTAIADAIREKNGLTTTYKPSQMGTAISNLPTGSIDTGDIPETAFSLDGNCSYKFYGGTWDWFCELYGTQIDGVITTASHMFYNSDLATIPFELFLGGSGYNNCDYMFFNCSSLKNVDMTIYTPNNLEYLFYGCGIIKTINLNIQTTSYLNESSVTGYFTSMFANCKKLTSISNLTGLYCYGTNENLLTGNAFRGCNALTAIRGLDIGVMSKTTSNVCGTTPFADCYALEELTFTSRETTLSNQSLLITGRVGYSANLEDSKYNHNSAVNTINSLPDVSGGTNNIIQFNGNSGANTDGGAINTLTETEIAVATAKGWTLSFA